MKTIEQFTERKDALTAEYDAMPALHLDIKNEYVPKHLDDKAFLEWLINVGVAMHNTVNDAGEVVCIPYKNRSMPDLYKLHNQYKPIKLQDLILNLLSLTRDTRLQTCYCGQILRRVWFSVHYGHGYRDDLRNPAKHTVALLDKNIKHCMNLTELLEYENLLKNPKKKVGKQSTTYAEMLTNFESGEERTVEFNPDEGTFRWTVPEGMRPAQFEPVDQPRDPFGYTGPAVPSIRIERMPDEPIEEFRERVRYVIGSEMQMNDNAHTLVQGQVTPEMIARLAEIRAVRLAGIMITRVDGETGTEFRRRINWIAGREVDRRENVTDGIVRLRYAAPDVIKRNREDFNNQWTDTPPSFIRIVRHMGEPTDVFVSRVNYIIGAAMGPGLNNTVNTPRNGMRAHRYNQTREIVNALLTTPTENAPINWQLFTPAYVAEFHSPF